MSTQAAPVAQPIAQPEDERVIAPWPAIDKFPVVIGPGLSLQYITSIFRLSLLGYRQQYVDLLDELLEKELHGFGVISKRVEAIAEGRLEIIPAEAKPRTRDAQTAKKLADECAPLLSTASLQEAIGWMQWATYYAIVGSEIHWAKDGRGWMPERLSFIHSRRLSYPSTQSWDLHIWDQGQVLSASYGNAPTNGVFGMRIADYPNKFVIHAPQIRGNYPTREGLGRQLAYWMALKLVAARGAPQYLERFARPWPEATYATGQPEDKRAASKEDVAAAKAALAAMGAGTLSNWVHADSVKLELKTPDAGKNSKIGFGEWIDICNSEMSKAVLGNTLTTEVGSSGGNRALGQMQQQGEIVTFKRDAKRMAATLRRDFIGAFMRLNHPDVPERLYPQIVIHVEDDPDPNLLVERATKMADRGAPVDADKLSELTGVPLVDPKDEKARRMALVKAIDLGAIDETVEIPEPPPAPGAAPPNEEQPSDDAEEAGADENDNEE